jgi:hypothetical protein
VNKIKEKMIKQNLQKPWEVGCVGEDRVYQYPDMARANGRDFQKGKRRRCSDFRLLVV